MNETTKPLEPDGRDHLETRTLSSLFTSRCAEQADLVAYVSLRDTLERAESVTYGQLYKQVCSLGCQLISHSEPGDRVLLVYPHGIDFIRAFWACLLTGRIAVPVPAPDAARFKNSAPRLLAIVRDASASLMLTTSELSQAARSVSDERTASSLSILSTTLPIPAPADADAACDSVMREADRINPDTVAYLQYTSGSTSTPRGAVLTHRAVIAQCWSGARAQAFTKDSRILSWLPHFHDYGLVLGALVPLYVGAPAYLMSPLTFLRRPLRWLEAIGRFGITHTGGPNFAYAACTLAASQQPAWRGDLSTLQSSSCGAEPIHIETMEAFSSTFLRHGFSDRVLMPSYGMAETVLGITTTPLGTTPRTAAVALESLSHHRVQLLPEGSAEAGQRIVSCGFPFDGMAVEIVAPDTRQVAAPDAIGEIWVRGASVGQGYWNQPEATEATFQAHLATGEGPWLRTGDLGFKQGGELFVTGRLKDLLIIRGRNLYPQDLELTAQAVDGLLRANYGAAFSVQTEEGEEAVFVQELERKQTSRNLGEVTGAIRRAIADEYELSLKSVVLVRSGTLPRTSSGKIKRGSCRQHYLDGTLQTIFVDAGLTSVNEHEVPVGIVETTLAAIWSEVLRRDGIGRRHRFLDLGGHSLLATQMVSRIRNHLGVELPLAAVFEHATLTDMAAEIERIRATEGTLPHHGEIAIPNVARTDPLPTSFSQRRMWLVQQMNPETTAYNMAFAMRLLGSLDVRTLEQSLDAVARHHEAFRTRFELVDDEPMQLIDRHTTLQLEVVDLDHGPDVDREAQTRLHMTERAQRSFDLSKSGLHRATLIRIREDDQILLWVIHHAIGDLWSAGVLFRNLTQQYEARLQGKVPAVDPARTIEFADYASWQRGVTHQKELARQLSYWRSRLRGLQTITLPADIQRRGIASGRGGTITATLPQSAISSLRLFSARHGVSPFMTLLACFKLLLARYCTQDDIAVGTPIANRHRLESEDLVGTFVNTLVMRTDLTGNPRFIELLGRVRDSALDAYANQDASFEQLVEELSVERDLSSSPLVQVMFNVLNAPFDKPRLGDVRIEPFYFDRGAAQFDLSMTVDTEIFGQVHIEYADDLFKRTTAQRLLDNYVGLLEQVLSDPDKPIHDYAIQSGAELAELASWNETRRAYPENLRVHELVGATALREPGICAIQHGTEALTFAQLEERTNRLAHALHARSIGRGSLVGLCVERGINMVVAQLAILKSGAAYVPLDPAYPADRLSYMAEDAKLALLVTESALMHALNWPSEDSLLLDIDSQAIAAQPDTALPLDEAHDARPEDPAYVIYTSGSTGKPKGVVVHHRAVVNFLTSMAHEPGLTAQDTLIAVTTLSFDIAVLELLLPLSVGARVVLASRDQALDGVALRHLIESTGATIMQATPSTWRVLIDSGWQGSTSFKALIGGEGLPQDLAIQLIARTGELWNMYGPTETTVWSTCWKVLNPENGISIGKPIANTTVHILDERQQPCPIGVPGEIYIGGDGVTLGYLHRPELTAERFITDPFGHDHFGPAARLYRTGDRGRWRHDGLLEHMGRLDFQVKVRGYRIELGEIESNLGSHPQVARTTVLVREDTPGDARLVAYVVPRDGMPDAHALREYLRANLPDYMVPQYFIELDAIPLLPNGKIDRRQLPAPTVVLSHVSSNFVAPRNAAEAAVAEVWGRLLGVPQVGVTDNFFDLGGHSLLAIRAITELNQRFGTKIHVRQVVFETLGQIAACITATILSDAQVQRDAATPAEAAVPMRLTRRWIDKLRTYYRRQ